MGPNEAAETGQPLEPIFQPELAARAIWWAAHHRRRELWVGFPAYKAIIGQKFLPALGDTILAREAWSGQMTDEPVAADRPYNLFAPANGDFGTHGPFDSRATESSMQLWLTMHRGAITSALAALVIGIGVFVCSP